MKDAGQKPYPKCSCGAGRCRKEKEVSGPDAGRGYFVCPIKKVYIYLCPLIICCCLVAQYAFDLWSTDFSAT